MDLYENCDLEFKETFVSDLKKDIIAFANSEGGILYVGINKNGEVVGVDNPDMVMQQIANILKDTIKPDIMPFVKIKCIKKDSMDVVEINVESGSSRPYYLADNGLKPSGVYVRKGSTSQPISDEGIREMIVETSGKSYENCRCMIQELTFDTFSRYASNKGLNSTESWMRNLHLINEDGLFTNLALLLSDQCEHSIKLAIFQGTDKALFRDRKEFTGSVLKQLEDVFSYIEFVNRTKATFKGLFRIDKRDYPMEAVREVLLNCIVHRDYSFSGSTLINVYEDRIEFVSLGGLVSGISFEAIMMGVSQSRNMNLANVFYRLELIESFGTGISKIQRVYDKEESKPNFETAQGVFKVVLYNCNEEHNVSTNSFKVMEDDVYLDDKDKILHLARRRGKIRRKDVETLLGIKQTRAFELLKELCTSGALHSVGAGRSSYYEYVDK